MIEIGNCKDCVFYNKLSEKSNQGLCTNQSVLLGGSDDGIEIHDKHLDSGMIIVGANYGCVHFDVSCRKKMTSVVGQLTDEQRFYITLVAGLLNEVTEERLITPAQRGQISKYLFAQMSLTKSLKK